MFIDLFHSESLNTEVSAASASKLVQVCPPAGDIEDNRGTMHIAMVMAVFIIIS
jgi:hypothetical protein